MDTQQTQPPRTTFSPADGNAFALIGSFQRNAKRDGWTRQQIEKQQAVFMASASYDELLQELFKVADPED